VVTKNLRFWSVRILVARLEGVIVVGSTCLKCRAGLNSTNRGGLCNICERKFVKWVAQLPKAKARLTREEWVNEGSPCVSRAEHSPWIDGDVSMEKSSI